LWPGLTSLSGGVFSKCMGLANEQRGAKRQPGFSIPRSVGTVPGMVSSFVFWVAARSMRGSSRARWPGTPPNSAASSTISGGRQGKAPASTCGASGPRRSWPVRRPNSGARGERNSTGGSNGPAVPGQGIAGFSGLITSQASSLYRAFTIKLDKRFSRGFLLTAHYTYSRDEDDDSNERDQFTFQFSDPINFDAERGPSNRDQRHRFSLFALWNLPWGLSWSNSFVAASARPRSALCNFDANGDFSASGDRVFTDGQGNFSCGPGGVESDGRPRVVELNPGEFVQLVPGLTNGFDTGRNAFRRDDRLFDWSMRIQKTWTFRERYHLIPMLEIFNITNHDNFRFPVCDELRDCLLGTFLQIPGEPTRVRLGARFEW